METEDGGRRSKRRRTMPLCSDQPEKQQPPSEPCTDAAALDILDGAPPDLPSDTMFALQILRSQFPTQQVLVRPVLLRSQLYKLVHDNSVVDRQLDTLRRERQVRMFKLPNAKNEYAFMMEGDYHAAVRDTKVELQAASGSPPDLLVVFDWFLDHLLSCWTEVHLDHDDLLHFLTTDRKGKPVPGVSVSEDHISLLINSGFLLRQIANQRAYWLGISGVGKLVKSLLAGRKEILGTLARRRRPEIFEKQLEERGLHHSVLGVRFHTRDLLGSGQLALVHSTAGPVLRLAKRA